MMFVNKTVTLLHISHCCVCVCVMERIKTLSVFFCCRQHRSHGELIFISLFFCTGRFISGSLSLCDHLSKLCVYLTVLVLQLLSCL